MKKYFFICFIVLLYQSNVKAQNLSPQNFIYSATPKKGVKENEWNTLLPKDINQNVTYYDGLGRPLQHIIIGKGEGDYNIIKPFVYDDFGRQSKEFLPYTISYPGNGSYKWTATIDILNYYNNPTYENTTNPYSEKAFEPSPLNRVIKQAAPGADWKLNSGHEIKFEYLSNTQTDQVKKFSIATSWDADKDLYTNSINTNNVYSDGQLYKTVTKDENWISGVNNTTEEYKNLKGQIVLKRNYNNGQPHDTYYVYNKYDSLVFVLSPLAEGRVNQNVLDGLCYQYIYDSRNRLAAKKIPGKLWEYIVYDRLDRPIITGPTLSPYGDGSQGVMVTEYDVYGRVVKTGWKAQAITASSRTAWQTNANSGATPLTIAENEVLTKNYYDTYTFPDAPTVPSSLPLSDFGVASNVKGMATGSWVRVCTTATEMLGETSYTLYDTKYRPIRLYTQNYLGGFTQIDSKLDYSGKTLETLTTHKRNMNSELVTVIEKFTFSVQDRLLTHTHQVNNEPIQLLSSNTYDELGQLMTKKVGGTDATGQTALQKVDYAYNIRGWLKGINNLDNLNPTENENDLFSFKLTYNNPVNNQALFNGNIAQAFWKTASDNIQRQYDYNYDNLNRLVSARTADNIYNENIEAYDKNGNILQLVRNGLLNDSSATRATLDVLNYYYKENSNVLLKVTDQTANPKGFKDDGVRGGPSGGISDPTDDYVYDAFGNLINDENKNISSIFYNHLNLPLEIKIPVNGSNDFNFKGGKITYIYNALGQKVRKDINSNNTGHPSQGRFWYDEYLNGGFQYISQGDTRSGYIYQDKLTHFPHAEGAYDFEKRKYIFNYKDHLGNVRVSYQDTDNNGKIEPTTEILQENNFYAMGSVHEGYNTNVNSYNSSLKYKYNGKELQDELGINMYTYGFRDFDPAIGRWVCIDPLAEKSRRWSPYNYCVNNPIRFIDPDGREIINIEGGVKFTGNDAQIIFKEFQKEVKKTGKINPIHFVYESATPNIYKHTLDSFKKGKPEVLHYDSNPKNRVRRRADALKGHIRQPGMSLDEYPYASTFEGGVGAHVTNVPVSEQSFQGAQLGGFGGIYRSMSSGDAFTVIPVPKDKEPDAVPEEIPVPNSIPNPLAIPNNNNPIITPKGVATVAGGAAAAYIAYKIIVAALTWECGGCGVLVTP